MTASMRAVVAALGVIGCANLPAEGDGVVALEVMAPSSLTLTFGETVQLEAQALDRNGDPVATATVTWATLDTTITVDAASGLVTAIDSVGTGRVQATVGTLHSDLITFTLQPPPGT